MIEFEKKKEEAKQPLQKPKRGRGRPSTGFNKNEYQRLYMADQKQAKLAGMTVKEYRANMHTNKGK